MNLDVFSIGHITWVLTFFLFLLLTYLFLRNKTNRFQFFFLVVLIALSWLVHFSRYFLDPNLRYHELFFTDFCGFSTLVYPLFFLAKKQVFKDYMVFASAIFAFLSMLYPNNIEGDPIFVFNSLRFFYAHFALVTVPLMMVLLDLHRPSIKSIPYAYLILVVAAWYNMALSAFFVEVGLVNQLINYGGLWGNTDSIYRIAERFAPFIVYTEEINNQLITKPIPFFYILPATIVILIPYWVLLSLPFRKKEPRTVGLYDFLNTSKS